MRAPLHVTQQHGADALVTKETENKGPHVAVEHADLSGDVVGAEDAHEGGRVPNRSGSRASPASGYERSALRPGTR